MNKLTLVALIVALLALTAFATRPLLRVQQQSLYDEEEEQGGSFGANVSNRGWGANVGHGGFNANVSGNWGSSKTSIGAGYSHGGWSAGVNRGPGGTTISGGYKGNLAGGQFNAGVSHSNRGGISAGFGWSKKFEEELDEAMAFMPRTCQCFRAPCNC